MILTQSMAMLVDAYRELNARKLFWVTMGLNLIVVVVYASLGISEKGPTFWIWTFDNQFFNSKFISPELFYKIQFVSWGTPVWLSWVATILALVSTAGIVPDLVAGGSIETMISKPISRVRLFLTKYTFGLMFAAMQVLVFSTGCFLVMWIRGGVIEPGLFMAVPIVVLFFSFLFSVCALLGLLTRSTVASLLLTMILWFLIFAVNATDALVLATKVQNELRVEALTLRLENQNTKADERIVQIEESGEGIVDGDGNEIEDLDDRRQAANPMIIRTKNNLEDAQGSFETWEMWSDRVILLKTILPKTGETIGLLDRYLVTKDELAKLMAENSGVDVDDEDFESINGPPGADPRVQARLQDEMRGRGVGWILGTSLLFEAVMLGMCCLIFSRRDF